MLSAVSSTSKQKYVKEGEWVRTRHGDGLWRAALAAASVRRGQRAIAAVGAPVPPVGGVIDQVGRTGQMAVDQLQPALGQVQQSAGQLANARIDRLDALVRANRDALEMTDAGPAVRGEIIAVDPDPASLAAAEAAGFTRLSEERIEGLDVSEVTLRVPRGWSVDRSLSRLRRVARTASSRPTISTARAVSPKS